MSEEYLSRCFIDVDGREIDLLSISEKEVKRRSIANTMHKSGTITQTPRFELTVKTLINADKTKNIDLSKIKGKTLSMVFDDLSRKIYPNVTGLSKGETTYDGEKATEQSYELVADEPMES